MEPPLPPNEADCCNSGCNPCIFDVYEEQLRKYNKNENVTQGMNCISGTSYTIFKLVEITQHTETTRLYTFQYVKPFRNEPIDNIGLFYEPGQHFMLRGSFNQSNFTRAYTPIPYPGTRELCFCVLIKLYDDGLMSQFVKKLQVHNETLWRGPYGDFKIDYTYRHVCFIAQGTGIAPIYAVINAMLANDGCDSFLRLFFCCKNIRDVPLRNELYALSSYWNFSYEVFLTDGDGVKTKYNEKVHVKRFGKVDLDCYVKDKSNVYFVICGNEAFGEIVSNYITDLGVDSSNVCIF